MHCQLIVTIARAQSRQKGDIPMKTQIRQPLYLLITVILALALVAASALLLGPPPASAQERVFYNPVSMIAHAANSSTCSGGLISQTEVDWFGKQAGAERIFASATAGWLHGAAVL